MMLRAHVHKTQVGVCLTVGFIRDQVKAFIGRYTCAPNCISIPIALLPEWREIVEALRIGPWHSVQTFDAMQVEYNTISPPDDLPVLVLYHVVEDGS